MRYEVLSENDRKFMLDLIGVSSADELYGAIPAELKTDKLDLPGPYTEAELLKHIRDKTEKNKTGFLSFLGGGAYEHFIPSVVKHVISRSEFYTAYTPYQAEASQGLLQAIYEYQSYVCRLTAMDVTMASHYDGATALAESVLMAVNITHKKKVLLSSALNPEYKAVLNTYLSGTSVEKEYFAFNDDFTVNYDDLISKCADDTAAVVVSFPNFLGTVENFSEVRDISEKYGALMIISGNPLSYAGFIPPGEYGADIACGDMQVFGNPLNFGGPYAGYIAVKKKFMRKLPGRIAGKTIDKNGKTAFVLTLQAREQHIRREKATSNICSNQALSALASLVHMSLLGSIGMKKMFEINRNNAYYLIEGLKKKSVEVLNENVFNEFVIKLNDIDKFFEKALSFNIMPGIRLGKFYDNMKNMLLVAVTETKTKDDLDKFLSLF